MSDGLKDYIDFKREDFELYLFDQKTSWDQLSRELESRKGNSRKLIWIAAAVVLLVVSSGILAGSLVTGFDRQGQEFHETQYYYQELIDSKLNLVKTKVEDPELLADLDALDMAFAELKEDLNDNVQNEEVITAMIDHYRLKLRILERILDELEDEDHEVDRNS